jgi:tetratricopeptide (TPR) repeat protein
MNMKFSLLGFFLLISILSTYAQGEDTSIFNTHYEQDLFEKLEQKDSFNLIDFMLAIDYRAKAKNNYLKLMKEITHDLDKDHIAEKPLKKQTKLIYKRVHASLKKYMENVPFTSTIMDGYYNCLTASALYASVLDHYQISYEIVKRPGHVYLIVAPDKQKIVLESTRPNDGLIRFTDRNKKEYVEFLVEQKIIDEAEYLSTSTNRLFNKYYFNDEVISAQQMVSLHYNNKAVFYFERENFPAAFREMQKSLLLNPDDELSIYLFNFFYSKILEEQFINKNYDGKMLGKYYLYNRPSDDIEKRVVSIFNEIAVQLVNENSQIDRFNQIYADMKAQLSSGMETKEVDFKYYFYNCYYEYVAGNFKHSLDFAGKAVQINPEHLQLKNMVHNIMINIVQDFDDDESEIELTNKYFEDFPFLLSYKHYAEFYMYTQVLSCEFQMDEGNDDTVLVILDRMNQNLEKNKAIVQPETVKEVYEYFYDEWDDKSDRDNLMAIFTDALSYYPTDPYLKEKIAGFKNGVFPQRAVYGSSKTYSSTTTPVYSRKRNHYTKEEYQQKFKDDFNGTWCASYYRQPSQKKRKRMVNEAKIVLTGTKTVLYKYEGKTLKGKWSVRPASKLLYFTPTKNSDNYIMFRVIKFSENHIELRPYSKDKKMANFILIFDRCD